MGDHQERPCVISLRQCNSRNRWHDVKRLNLPIISTTVCRASTITCMQLTLISGMRHVETTHQMHCRVIDEAVACQSRLLQYINWYQCRFTMHHAVHYRRTLHRRWNILQYCERFPAAWAQRRVMHIAVEVNSIITPGESMLQHLYRIYLFIYLFI